jgi:hypothetical protein
MKIQTGAGTGGMRIKPIEISASLRDGRNASLHLFSQSDHAILQSRMAVPAAMAGSVRQIEGHSGKANSM